MNKRENAVPLVSFVISTHNRRDVLLNTLSEIERCGLDRDRFEMIVVDNASTDQTSAAVTQAFPAVQLISLDSNRGSCAKNIAIERASGEFIIFLDDDSYPIPGAVQRMLQHFVVNRRLGAAVFTVTLPDGSRECSAYPNVFIGCGTGFRKEAIDDAGPLPEDFFMQAEEYDLSLRLLQAGWDIQTFDDLHVNHLKTPNARRSWRTMRLDVRNNFIVATRYVPRRWLLPFMLDWMQRYHRIAGSKSQQSAFWIGLAQGVLNVCLDRRRNVVSHAVFERFARVNQIELAMQTAKKHHNLQSVLLVDYGKNIYPYWIAAKNCGIRIVAIADNKLHSCSYRGIPLINDSVARRLEFDAAIVSNLSPVHAQARLRAWHDLDSRPVIDLIPRDSSAIKSTGLAA